MWVLMAFLDFRFWRKGWKERDKESVIWIQSAEFLAFIVVYIIIALLVLPICSFKLLGPDNAFFIPILHALFINFCTQKWRNYDILILFLLVLAFQVAGTICNGFYLFWAILEE